MNERLIDITLDTTRLRTLFPSIIVREIINTKIVESTTKQALLTSHFS